MPDDRSEDIVQPAEQREPLPTHLLEEAYAVEGLKQPARKTKAQPIITDAGSFVELFKRNLPRIDRDHDRFITRAELDDAIKSQAFNGQDAQLLSALKIAFTPHGGLSGAAWTLPPLSSLSNDSWGNDVEIAESDIDQFGREREAKLYQRQVDEALSEFALKNFSEMDSDQNGIVYRDELRSELAEAISQDLSDQRRDMIHHLIRNIEILKTASDGITRNDLATFPKRNYERTIPGQLDKLVRDSGGRLPNFDRSLFANQLNPIDSIRPEAVDQGKVGDCYFVAAIAALSQQNPKAIENMITDHGNGEYTVKFPGADRPVKIPGPTDTELVTYARGGKFGVWPAVLEKAYGAYRRSHLLTFSNSPLAEYADGGSATHDGLRILTGHPIGVCRTSTTSKVTMVEILEHAISNQTPVTAFTGLGTKDPHLPQPHEYAVLEYDRTTELLTIYNPWGPEPERDHKGEPMTLNGEALDGKPDGFFQMSLDHFYQSFSGIAIPVS